MLTDIAAILAFGEKYGWGLVIALFVLYKLITNAGKIADRLGKAAGAVSPSIGKALDERRKEKEAQRVEKAVETSAELAAKIEQSDAALHHEFDAEAANQAYQMRQQSELMGMLKETLQHFWEDKDKHDSRDNERWEKVYTALLRVDSAMSLNTMTVERQAAAYGELECVKAARRAERRRKTNGDE